MLPPIGPELLASGFAVCLGLLVLRYRKDKAHVAGLQHRATMAFDACEVGSTDPRFAFSGKTATIERREEAGGVRGIFEAVADFSVTIHATNHAGEPFLFKWHSKSPRPFIKHLPQPKATK